MPVAESHVNLLKQDQTVFVVIDMQDALLRVIPDAEQITRNARILAQGASILQVPIVATSQSAEKLGALTLPLRAVLPPAQPPYDKVAFSCLDSPPFAAELERLGRKQVVLCGIEAHICVSQTAHALLAAGYQVHVVADAIASRTPLNAHIGLEKMQRSGTLITSTEMALYELMREAGTNAFREILRLVK